MRCELCGEVSAFYTGLVNPWSECRNCGGKYCHYCTRGQESPSGSAAPEHLYVVAKQRACPRCNHRLTKA